MDPQSLARLKDARDPREFLRLYFELSGVSYASFGRKAGLSSRSFPRDVVTGKRKLSARSLQQFQRALALPAAWKSFFRVLVLQEQPDLLGSSGAKDPERLERERARALDRLELERTRPARSDGEADSIVRIRRFLPIFAALGDPRRGATLARIRERTGLSDALLLKSLAEMERAELVLREGDGAQALYRPASFHVDLTQAGGSGAMKALYLDSLEATRKRAESRFDSKTDLFFMSSFCVDEARLPELKGELRQLLLKYVDESIDCEGRRLAHLTSGLVLG